MKDPQEVRTELAKSNEEKIRRLRDEYVDMFLEQLEKNNSKYTMYPAIVRIELIQDVENNTMKSETRSAEFNLQALYEAQKLLNESDGYDVRVKKPKFSSIFYEGSNFLGKRLCGKVRIG